MAATGHKTMSTFKRYNPVSGGELKTLTVERAVAPDAPENWVNGHQDLKEIGDTNLST
jgi:hypothetical protein